MNQYFYFQPRNFRHLNESEGCAPRRSLKPAMSCGFGAAIGIGLSAAGLGLGVYGAVSSAKNVKSAEDANNKASAQATTQQIANLTNQVAADQASVAASDSSKKTWEYVSVGAGVVAAIGTVMFLMNHKKEK